MFCGALQRKDIIEFNENSQKKNRHSMVLATKIEPNTLYTILCCSYMAHVAFFYCIQTYTRFDLHVQLKFIINCLVWTFYVTNSRKLSSIVD